MSIQRPRDRHRSPGPLFWPLACLLLVIVTLMATGCTVAYVPFYDPDGRRVASGLYFTFAQPKAAKALQFKYDPATGVTLDLQDYKSEDKGPEYVGKILGAAIGAAK